MAAVIIIFLLLPVIFPSRFLIHLVSVALILAIGALSMDLIMGFTGQCSLAQGGFFGIGAYAYSIAVLKFNCNVWVAFALGSILTAGIGCLIGILSLRTRGPYFAIVTLVFNVLISIVIENWDEVTGGAMGLTGIKGLQHTLPLGKVSPLFSLENISYYLSAFFLLAMLLIMHRLVKSFLGKSMIAVRENEDFAEAIGINTLGIKILSFTLSTFIAGVGGILYVSTLGFLGPESAHYHMGFDFLSFMIVGGQGTLIGPLIGTFILQAVPTFLQTLPEYRLFIFGFLLIFMIIFLPTGFMGAFKLLRQRITSRVGQKG
jgi:branched-chain amino acid transport system permease protein